jgi:hypothetical protein
LENIKVNVRLGLGEGMTKAMGYTCSGFWSADTHLGIAEK